MKWNLWKVSIMWIARQRATLLVVSKVLSLSQAEYLLVASYTYKKKKKQKQCYIKMNTTLNQYLKFRYFSSIQIINMALLS